MKLLFIISHRYYRQYQTFTEVFINNINKYYGDNADILIVDNNSVYIKDVEEMISKYKNIKMIINTSEGKFEIGAYRFGINFLGNSINNYEYIIFSQDTFILKNKYDFNNLIKNNVKACTIVKHIERPYLYGTAEIAKNILEQINMYNKLDEITFCWCTCFILHKSAVNNFMNLTNHIKITVRKESEAGERYLARILYELNDCKNYDIDGFLNDLKYDKSNANMFENDDTTKDYFFQKRYQGKRESTPDM